MRLVRSGALKETVFSKVLPGEYIQVREGPLSAARMLDLARDCGCGAIAGTGIRAHNAAGTADRGLGSSVHAD